MPASTRSGRAWSWTASTVVMRSNRSVPSRVAASLWTKQTVVRPRRWASAVAAARPVSDMSNPTKRLAGNAAPIRLTAVTGSAADVGDVDARPEALDEAAHQRQGDLDEGGVVDGAAVLGHQGLESRERRIPNAAAVAEAAQDV